MISTHSRSRWTTLLLRPALASPRWGRAFRSLRRFKKSVTCVTRQVERSVELVSAELARLGVNNAHRLCYQVTQHAPARHAHAPHPRCCRDILTICHLTVLTGPARPVARAMDRAGYPLRDTRARRCGRQGPRARADLVRLRAHGHAQRDGSRVRRSRRNLGMISA